MHSLVVCLVLCSGKGVYAINFVVSGCSNIVAGGVESCASRCTGHKLQSGKGNLVG